MFYFGLGIRLFVGTLLGILVINILTIYKINGSERYDPNHVRGKQNSSNAIVCSFRGNFEVRRWQ